MSTDLQDNRHIRDGARLLDLVRFCRGELHQALLITDEEYAELITIDGSPARLETYDQIRDENTVLKAFRKEVGRLVLQALTDAPVRLPRREAGIPGNNAGILEGLQAIVARLRS